MVASTTRGAGPGLKKLFIKSYGCQMNVYDSARMADVLAPLGYAPVDEAVDADLIILNTCHIREKAAEKVFSDLGRMHGLKIANGALIAVAGCVAQAEGEEIARRAPYVDMVFGPQTYHRLPEMVARLHRRRGGGAAAPLVDTEFPPEPKFDHLPQSGHPPGVSAFVSIQEGCDKFCTFCVVPYTRGPEYSRPAAAIEDEARRMVDAGAREITLLGQNVNAYRGAAPNGGTLGLAALVRRLARIEGLARIRYTTSHPRDVDEALIAAHEDEPKLMPHLHLPVQSGSDRILAAMNRGHRVDAYLRIVARLRRARGDLALTSDFIVGFPGESERDFALTLALVREVGFAAAYSFKYSKRPGTPASLIEDQVPEPEKEARLHVLQAVLREQQNEFNTACVGRVMPVLLEKAGRRAGQYVGRSPYLQAVHVTPGETGGEWIGRIVEARIVEAGPNSLAGTIAAPAARDCARLEA
ncbi:MAG TPA: tRNA (N6-isopentenyl adenosine(37)-C2)-methylthiotransferase MiaB [Alphaproteobacteria bacterium]|nr:tRNA (N6-isopentenyl adenosine(37)-C2)-methylthiotransferase MiaB [Alphaproteobacteria bacterium]